MTGASRRPSRVLAGWLDEEACRSFALDDGASRDCREAARARTRVRFLTGIEPSPESLGPVVAGLSDVDPRFRDGELAVAVVDLAGVIATQPIVAVDDLRVDSVNHDASLAEIAAVTVPMAPQILPTTAFDERAQTWVVRSRGASVGVAGRYLAAAESGDPGSQYFGFLVSAQPSRVTVAIHDGRVVMLDGHHRAVALLARGVRRAPVALDRATRLVLSDDHFRRDVIFGEGPPLVCDYLDDQVSLESAVTRTERVILISATEIDLPV